jgi:hypothetical protein
MSSPVDDNNNDQDYPEWFKKFLDELYARYGYSPPTAFAQLPEGIGGLFLGPGGIQVTDYYTTHGIGYERVAMQTYAHEYGHGLLWREGLTYETMGAKANEVFASLLGEAVLRQTGYGSYAQVPDVTWKRWAPFGGAAYAEYQAPTYDPFAQWGANIGEYGFLMRSLAPLYAASVFRQAEAIPQYAQLAGIYGQQANYFAARAAYHAVLGDYEQIPADVYRVYRSAAHEAYYDWRATAGAPAGLISSTFKLASFAFPPGTGLGAVGVGWRALGWPFFGAYGQLGAATNMAPYVSRMYQIFPDYTQALITGQVPQGLPQGMGKWYGPSGFLQTYTYPTMEEAIGGGVGQWTVAQVGMWSALAGIQARMAGESFQQAIQQTIIGTMGMSLFQAGLGISMPIIAARTARAISGLPEFFTPQEQQQAYLQFGVGIGLQVGGAAWQAWIAPRFGYAAAATRAAQLESMFTIQEAVSLQQFFTPEQVLWAPERGVFDAFLPTREIPGGPQVWVRRAWNEAIKYQEETYGLPVGPMVWQPSWAARGLTVAAGVAGAYGLSSLLGNLGARVSPTGELVGNITGAIGGYLGASAWAAWALKTAGMGAMGAPPPALGLSALLGPIGVAAIAYQTYAMIEDPRAIAFRWQWQLENPLVPMPPQYRYTTAGLLAPGQAVTMPPQVWESAQIQQWQAANPWTPMPPEMRYLGVGLAPARQPVDVQALLTRYGEIYRNFMTAPWSAYYDYVPPSGRLGPSVYAGSRWQPMPVEGLEQVPRHWDVSAEGYMTEKGYGWSRYYQYPGMAAPGVYAGMRGPVEQPWWPMQTIFTQPPGPTVAYRVPQWNYEYQYLGMKTPVAYGARYPEPGMWPIEVAWYGTTGYVRNVTTTPYQYPGMPEAINVPSRYVSPWTGVSPSAPGREPFGPYTYWQDGNLMRAGVGGWTIDVSTGQLIAPETGAYGKYAEAYWTMEYAGFTPKEEVAALVAAGMSENIAAYLVSRGFEGFGRGGRGSGGGGRVYHPEDYGVGGYGGGGYPGGGGGVGGAGVGPVGPYNVRPSGRTSEELSTKYAGYLSDWTGPLTGWMLDAITKYGLQRQYEEWKTRSIPKAEQYLEQYGQIPDWLTGWAEQLNIPLSPVQKWKREMYEKYKGEYTYEYSREAEQFYRELNTGFYARLPQIESMMDQLFGERLAPAVMDLVNRGLGDQIEAYRYRRWSESG